MTQIITSRWWWGWGGGWADMLKCVYDPNNCNADAFDYCNFSNTPDLSCYQTKACMVCDLTWADNNHYPSAKAVSDALQCAWAWDMLKSVYDPNNCNTDAFNYNNMYNKLTAGSGINITANAISTASNFGTSSTAAATVQKEVSIPWITTLATWQIVHILPSITSTVANSTLKVNNFTAYPMRYNNAAITTSTDSIVRPANIVTTFVFDGTYWQFVWHWLDSNTTYSNMSAAEAVTWTCASWRSIAACTLKCAINTHAPISTSAYGSWWCGSNSAPTQNAVYAKVSAIDELIPSAATCSNQLADKDYVNDSINSVTAFYITKNADGDQFATYAELAAATTFYSWGVVRVPTRNDYTIVLDDENHDDEVTRYIYNSGWEYQYTINESPLTQAQLDALNSWITAAKVTHYDTIPTITDNCQIANGCGYTTCTGTISTCSQIISALWYTPYNSTNPSWYTTCTWTLTASNISDTAFWASWDGDTTTAPSKNAIYDKIVDMNAFMDGTPYTQAEYEALEQGTPSVLSDNTWRVIYE